MERREAQGLCAKGPARPGTPIPSENLGSRNLGATHRPRKPVKGASQAPWRLPALHSLERGRRKTGYGQPGRPNNKPPGSGALAERLRGCLKIESEVVVSELG